MTAFINQIQLNKISSFWLKFDISFAFNKFDIHRVFEENLFATKTNTFFNRNEYDKMIIKMVFVREVM